MTQVKPHEKLGSIGRQLCWLFDGLIIGSSTSYFYPNLYPDDREKPKDIDIVIPLHLWTRACQIIPKNATVNRFGGFKFTDDNGIPVDVWTDDVAHIALNTYSDIYSPKLGRLLTAE